MKCEVCQEDFKSGEFVIQMMTTECLVIEGGNEVVLEEQKVLFSQYCHVRFCRRAQ